MSGSLIIPIVQTPTRHHLAIEDEEQGIASVEVIYHEHEYGRKVLIFVTPDVVDLTVQVQVKQA